MAQQLAGAPNLIRAVNDRAALEALARRGPLTRPEIGALLGLSKPTASELLARLQQAGLVISLGVREGGPGRAAGLYGINPTIGHVACLDVAPARIEVRVADILGEVVGEFQLPTPGRAAPDVVELLRTGLEGACDRAGLAVGQLRQAVIGIQGALNPYTGKLGYAAHLPGWHAPDLREHLQDGLGVRVAVENDVNLAALAEQGYGLAQDSRAFLLLWVSDGLGMAMVIDGRLHRGATGGAGEIGYMPAPGAPIPHPSARPANYGFHALAGGPALRRALREHGFHGGTPAAAVQAAARAWDAAAPDTAERAARALTELAHRLATGLAAAVAVVDPELVILSGDAARAGGEPLRDLIERELHAMTIPKPPVRRSTVAGNPVLAGALQVGLATARDQLFGPPPAPGLSAGYAPRRGRGA